MRYRVALAAVALLLIVACGPAGSVSPSPTGQPTLAPPTPGTTMPTDGPLEQVTELALADLATRLRVPPEEIEVIRAEQVTWPDGSLGCPQPEMVYTQALVEGYRVILGHESRVYLFHAGSDAQPFMCESDEPDGGYDFVPPPGFDE